jgi:hypothetical protein
VLTARLAPCTPHHHARHVGKEHAKRELRPAMRGVCVCVCVCVVGVQSVCDGCECVVPTHNMARCMRTRAWCTRHARARRTAARLSHAQRPCSAPAQPHTHMPVLDSTA